MFRHYGRSTRRQDYTPCGKFAADVIITYDPGRVTCPDCAGQLRPHTFVGVPGGTCIRTTGKRGGSPCGQPLNSPRHRCYPCPHCTRKLWSIDERLRHIEHKHGHIEHKHGHIEHKHGHIEHKHGHERSHS